MSEFALAGAPSLFCNAIHSRFPHPRRFGRQRPWQAAYCDPGANVNSSHSTLQRWFIPRPEHIRAIYDCFYKYSCGLRRSRCHGRDVSWLLNVWICTVLSKLWKGPAASSIRIHPSGWPWLFKGFTIPDSSLQLKGELVKITNLLYKFVVTVVKIRHKWKKLRGLTFVYPF